MSVFEGKLKKAQVKGKQRGLKASQPKGRKEGRQKERKERKQTCRHSAEITTPL